MLHEWLINLRLSLVCVPAVMVVNVFWLSYLQWVSEFNIDEAVPKIETGKERLETQHTVRCSESMWGEKKEQHDKNTRRHCLAFIKHANLKAKKQNKTWYCSCLDLYSTHWIILLEEWIIYIIVHVCSFSCFEADAAPAVWRTSEVFRWNWKYWIEDESFDRTGGGKKASWLRGEIKMQRQETYSFL